MLRGPHEKQRANNRDNAIVCVIVWRCEGEYDTRPVPPVHLSPHDACDDTERSRRDGSDHDREKDRFHVATGHVGRGDYEEESDDPSEVEKRDQITEPSPHPDIEHRVRYER